MLPFANMSADPENEYFCDGLAEEVLNALAKIERLKVAARTSAFSFKGRNVPVAEVGRALNVGAVLEGGVRRAGDRLRITAQLINVSDGYHLWSERYDRRMEDVFDIQDEITLAIVEALKVKLLGEEKAALLKRYVDNTAAYELYLKGRHHYHKYTSEGWETAVEYFERAIEQEPEYAPAYAGMAQCWIVLWYYGFLNPREIAAKWKAATRRALEIDDALADAHLMLATDLVLYEWDWVGAEREYRRAIELNPNSADARWGYGTFLVIRERFDEAVAEARRAAELDPLSLSVGFQVGWIYLLAGRLDAAGGQARKLIESEPRFYGGHRLKGAIFLLKRMYEEAAEAYQKSYSLGGNQLVLSVLGGAYGLWGKRDEALGVLNQLLEMRERRHVPACNIARIYFALGENDRGFEWLERGYEEHDGEMVFLRLAMKTLYGQDELFRDQRLSDLLRRVGLPS